MITPVFKVNQNDQFILLDIFAKFIKANDVEIYVEDTLFKFYVKPYFLRLNFPGQLCDETEGSSKYDVGEGVFHFKLKKKTAGEFFEDLDMLTTLMATKKGINVPLIEELGDTEQEEGDVGEDDDENSWDWPQQPAQPIVSDLTGKYGYGFANNFTDILSKFQEEIEEFMDVQSPDTTSYEERHKQRIEQENTKFDVEHYVADYFEKETIQRFCDFNAPWQPTSNEHDGKFDEDEQSVLMQLTNKSYILSKTEERRCLLGLVDILFAYCYNCRTTEGDSTSESPWTLCKLSSTLSWLDTFDDLKEALVSCYRRSLCFPLYRNWELSDTVFEDVKTIFRSGKIQLVKSLIAVRKILMSDESRYILNELYIKDYIVWVQTLSKSKLHSFGEWLDGSGVDLPNNNNEVSGTSDHHQNSNKVHKSDVGFNLEQIENIFSSSVVNTSGGSHGDGDEDGSQSSGDGSSDGGDDSDVQSSLDSDDEEAT